jgi:hypothetical protein
VFHDNDTVDDTNDSTLVKYALAQSMIKNWLWKIKKYNPGYLIRQIFILCLMFLRKNQNATARSNQQN